MVSYNVSLFTSNKHPSRARARTKGSLLAPLLSSPFTIFSSSHSQYLDPSREFVRVCAIGLFKNHIFLCCFYFFYTSYTLLPNNTINRYFLLLSSVPSRSSPGNVQFRTKIIDRYRLLLSSLSSSFSLLENRRYLLISLSRAYPRREEKVLCDIFPDIYIHLPPPSPLQLFLPFPLSPQVIISPHLTRIIYIRLARFAKNIREW